jgi:G3E family GTPase
MTNVQPIQRIPLTVIGGFLGAGKTSLLVHWLQQTQGKRIAVLVNDFGDINIDAELLRQSNSNTIALSNGCVCCEIGGDLSNALLKVLVDPEPFDAIVVEASGVSDPWPIRRSHWPTSACSFTTSWSWLMPVPFACKPTILCSKIPCCAN